MIVPIKVEYEFPKARTRSPYIPYSIYLRGTRRSEPGENGPYLLVGHKTHMREVQVLGGGYG